MNNTQGYKHIADMNPKMQASILKNDLNFGNAHLTRNAASGVDQQLLEESSKKYNSGSS